MGKGLRRQVKELIENSPLLRIGPKPAQLSLHGDDSRLTEGELRVPGGLRAGRVTFRNEPGQ